ncbi:hypothetical protein PJE062_2230 [Pseudovibrio sp. JE062]|nr:hypothetical protein PJE062_2230 [Pseudovibrio sp. JE062]
MRRRSRHFEVSWLAVWQGGDSLTFTYKRPAVLPGRFHFW